MKKLFSLLLAVALLLSLAACTKQKEYNIFTEFATVTEDSILPRHAEYGQSLTAVMQAKNQTEKDVTGTKDRYIITEYTAEHIPYKITERLSFVSDSHEENKNQLYRVEYVIEVKEAHEEAFAAFYEQAKAALPAPDAHLNSLEDMKSGGSVVWTDKEGNTLSFSTSDAQDGMKVVIISMRGGAYQRNLENE